MFIFVKQNTALAIVKSKLKYISFFLLLIFVSSQIFQLGHAVEHVQAHYETGYDNEPASKSFSAENNVGGISFKTSKAEADHQHCHICSHNLYQFPAYIPAIADHHLSVKFAEVAQLKTETASGTPVEIFIHHFGLRGPPSLFP